MFVDRSLRPTHLSSVRAAQSGDVSGGGGDAAAAAQAAKRPRVEEQPPALGAAPAGAARGADGAPQWEAAPGGPWAAQTPLEEELLGAFPQPGEYDPRRPSDYEATLERRLRRRQERARRRAEAERALAAAERAELARASAGRSAAPAEAFDTRPSWMRERDALRERALEAARAVGLGEGVRDGMGARAAAAAATGASAAAAADAGPAPDPMATHVAVAIAQASNISPTAAHMMLRMGFRPGEGLGKTRSGMVTPLRHQLTATGAGRLVPAKPHAFLSQAAQPRPPASPSATQ
jgi:hypothetical protein